MLSSISRKAATQIISSTFEMFHFGLISMYDLGIKNEKVKDDFFQNAWKLDQAINTDDYIDTLHSLDAVGFKEYYKLVGVFAKKYKIANWKDYNDYEPIQIEQLNLELIKHEKTEEKLELVDSFHEEELQSEKFLFSSKVRLLYDILDDNFIGDDKEEGINKVLESFNTSDKASFIAKIQSDRNLLESLIDKVNGTEKDEMFGIIGELFITSGFISGKKITSLNNSKNDSINAEFEKGRVNIEIESPQKGGMRDYRTTITKRISADPFDIIGMTYDGRQIQFPALLLLKSWTNTFGTPEGIFYNYYKENLDWNKLSDAEKDEYFTDFVKHYMGEALFNELAGNPLGLLVITIVGILLAYLAVIPAAIMAIAGAGLAGANIYAGSKMLTSALEQKQKASNMHEYKKAAKLFAESIAKIGVNTLMLIISLIQTGKAVFKGKVIELTPKKSIFKYKHDPSENPKVLQDAIVDKKAVYGYSPNPESTSRISNFANGELYNWSNSDKVKIYRERRIQYHKENDNIDRLIIEMKKKNKSIEEIARAANERRNQNRLDDYIKRNDFDGLKKVKKSNLQTYRNELGITAEDALKKYGTWEKVIEKTKSANPGMDACCGLYDEYYDLYDIN